MHKNLQETIWLSICPFHIQVESLAPFFLFFFEMVIIGQIIKIWNYDISCMVLRRENGTEIKCIARLFFVFWADQFPGYYLVLQSDNRNTI